MVVSDEVAVLAVLDRFRAGWEARDANMVLACFARDPEITVIGTDEGEYWRGFDALVGPFDSMFAAFSDLEYRWANPPHTVVHADLAWVDAVLDTQMTAGEQKVAVRMRSTWVLRRGADWEVVQAHFSVAPAAPVAAY